LSLIPDLTSLFLRKTSLSAHHESDHLPGKPVRPATMTVEDKTSGEWVVEVAKD
jgi:hypothetical protein